MNLDPQQALVKFWGYEYFRPQQQEIISAVLAGKDAVALLPTGGGKSLCYQIPAVVREGIVLVVSPLLSLMRDQVMQLSNKGIKAMYIPGGTPYQELDTLLDNCIYGNYKLLYLSPERLQQELVIERIKQMNISLLAIDEAHCISQWGHDFRPAYRNIATFRQLIPEVNCLAVTATATPQVTADMLAQLELKEPQVFQTSFQRKNLAYLVLREEDKLYRLKRIFSSKKGSGIVYVRSRKTAHKYAAYLNANGIKAHFYHGGLANKERDTRFTDWMENTVQVMVATSAFGMGIDKADVQTVVHVELPESLESYFQEAGRAGRNGDRAGSIILYGPGDTQRLKNQFVKILPTVAMVRLVYKRLNSYFQISYGEGTQENFRFNFMNFCMTYDLNTLTTYNALQVLDRNSVLLLGQEFFRKASLQIKVSPVTLTYNLIKNPGIDLIIKTILRTYGGIFDQPLNIDHSAIAKKTNVSVAAVHDALLQLEKDDLVIYAHESFDTAITFLVPREDDHVINTIARNVKAQNKRKIEQVEAILYYVENDSICRSVQLLSYFGEKGSKPCGKCDICAKKSPKTTKNPSAIAEKITSILREQAMNSRSLCIKLPDFTEAEILLQLKNLLEEGQIELTQHNTYILKK
ncbi:ATP-dependent DNA helicase RecQ [Flavimarina sp. Hel_I_48]|uniref:RecQ family ATP-dependent DNA helicase n=1 Tax=Flavimarina sp. Hel_I_48 TaxID=1392488 RepID=UPI0004DEFDBF|nr:ATP-dependent DNA helicase RecQ [Flavimarina sp. Hel_I_48]